MLQDETLIEYERRLSAAKSAARMQRTLQRKEQVLEERRQVILAAEAAAEMRMQQKEEVRWMQTRQPLSRVWSSAWPLTDACSCVC